MQELQLLVDLHKGADRQGPGGEEETERAVELAGLDREAPLRIADIGCGTGASSLVLARLLNAEITAVDFIQEFLEVLEARAEAAGLADNISTLCQSMGSLPFPEGEFDVIWSEGAIYNIGFETGVREWRRFLKPGGVLVVSEISWLTGTRPGELEVYWEGAYREIDTPSAKLNVLERHGYSPTGFFVLPERCWLDNYYRPTRAGFDAFILRNGNSEEARKLVESEREEIALYEKYREYYGYGMYIAKKVRDTR